MWRKSKITGISNITIKAAFKINDLAEIPLNVDNIWNTVESLEIT
jgi:hypothetical protein